MDIAPDMNRKIILRAQFSLSRHGGAVKRASVEQKPAISHVERRSSYSSYL